MHVRTARALLALLLLVAGVWAMDSDALARLERQVDELRRQREEDHAQVEWAKAEVDRVRRERDKDASSLRLASQCHTTAQWLREQLEHVQAEMRELASAQNVSVRLRREGATDTRLRLLERDLAETRHELHKARVALADHAQRIKQSESDAKELRRTQLEPIHLQMEELQEQVRSLETAIGIPQKKVPLDNNVWDLSKLWELPKHKPDKHLLRHQGGMRALRHELHVLSNNHTSLIASLHQWKRQIEQSHNNSVTEVRSHLASMEKTLRNASSWAAGVSQLRSSTIQLFEAVAELQDEGGRRAGVIQKELAHLEADLTQAAAASNAGRKSLQSRVESVRASLRFNQDSMKQLQRDEPRRLLLHEMRLVQLEEHVSRLQEAMHHTNNTSNIPKDCESVSHTKIVTVLPPNLGHTVRVHCHVDEGIAWTVIQDRKERDTADFDRDWKDYSKGFGDPEGSNGIWLGNEAIHALTASAKYALRLELWDKNETFWFAQYDTFIVDNEKQFFKLHLGDYHGNASDAFKFHDGMAFSTRDADHDTSSEHCAKDYHGGWWYGHCEHANLNGRGPLGLTWYDLRTQQWLPLTRARMKIRRRAPHPPT